MSEISDEEVDYGSFESIANPHTDSDHAWSTCENAYYINLFFLKMIVKTKWQGYIDYTVYNLFFSLKTYYIH